MDLALLLLRLVIGGLFIGHGAQKAFGWFGGYGFAATRGFFAQGLRLRPAGFWTVLAIAGELGGGLLLATGLLTPVGALGVVGAMLSAAVLAHWPRFWITENGIEYTLVAAVIAAAIGLAGPGSYALDAALGIRLPTPGTFLVGLVPVVVTFLIALWTRRPAVVPAASEEAPPAKAA